MSVTYPPITLTTDFGTRDHYVAQMKGVILGINPHATIVDITHEIEPQDVRQAAHLIGDLAPAFPKRTVHIAVIDPGVGSGRAVLAVIADEQFYIAPDNGLLTAVLERHPDAELVALTPPSEPQRRVSSTFHGRDIMAPAAARLLSGTTLGQIGQPLDRSPILLTGLAPRVEKGRVLGEIARVDRFGNLITSIPTTLIDGFPRDRLRARFGETELIGLKAFYSEVAHGEPLLLVGSSGRLEIAVNGGSAAAYFGVSAGSTVIIDRLTAS